MRVAVIDYKLCNLDSITRALEHCGASVITTDDPSQLAEVDRLVLPGVGAFAAAMHNLDAAGLSDAIRHQVAAGKPLLGICLGMHLMFSRSEEGAGVAGLDLIAGDVVRLAPMPDERTPHIGWNVVDFTRSDPLFDDMASGTDFYFVHSYHVRCSDDADSLATTPYGGGFTSVTRRGHVMGVQFHPEKSQTAGFAFLKNYLAQPAVAAVSGDA